MLLLTACSTPSTVNKLKRIVGLVDSDGMSKDELINCLNENDKIRLAKACHLKDGFCENACKLLNLGEK